jgi:hypothetical protein
MNAGPSLLAPERRVGSHPVQVCVARDRGDIVEPQREINHGRGRDAR